MNAFFDATCSHCGARVSWRGTLSQKPPCSKCGRWDKPSQLETDMMETWRRLGSVGYNATHNDLAKMQEWSGLSVGQLAGRLGVPASTVRNVMNGKSRVSESVFERWVDLCGFAPRD